MFANLDSNKDGVIDCHEFKQWINKKLSINNKDVADDIKKKITVNIDDNNTKNLSNIEEKEICSGDDKRDRKSVV